MKSKLTHHLLATLLGVALTAQVCAQTSTFTYQGLLTENGTPANGFFDIFTELWDASSGGAPVGTAITNTAVLVSNGLFTVTLDFGSGAFGGSDRWLEIGVATNGGGTFSALSPRQLITSAPYAIMAANALTVNMGTITDPGFIGTTTTAPLQFQVSNTVGLRLEYPTTGNVPNVIGGSSGNLVGSQTAGAAIGGGSSNTILSNASCAVISGGNFNKIKADSAYGTIGGGFDNSLLDQSLSATIAGGVFNEIGFNCSESVIGGGSGNTISSGSTAAAILAGSYNEIGSDSDYATIGGGYNNSISNESAYASIGGGNDNHISFQCFDSYIGGGYYNIISNSALFSAIVGGYRNGIGYFGSYNFIGGGIGNDIAEYSTHATVVGGFRNSIAVNSSYSFIGGGYSNNISSNSKYATIAGGRDNSVGPGVNYAFAAGRRAKANHQGAFVWADSEDADFASTSSDQFLIRAVGGVGIGTTAPTAPLHVQTPNNVNASIRLRSGTGYYLVMNQSPDSVFTITNGGQPRFTVEPLGDIGIGTTNPVTKLHVTDVGSAEISIESAEADGHRWTLQSSTPVNGARFEIIDRTLNASRITILTNGNVGIGTISPTNNLHVIGGVSATSFVTTSDQNAKENFAEVDPAAVLEKVVALPLSRWNFKDQTDGEHLGPMAQDFRAAFGLGNTDTGIATVDADGVALAAIQGLNEKVEGRSQKAEVRIQKLETENAELRQELQDIKQLLTTLTQKGNKL